MSRTPDIEIYIKRAELSEILAWLAQHFEIADQAPAGETTKVSLRYEGEPLTCTIFPGAAKGGYVSVWFEKNVTPWQNDAACAEDAFAFFDREVRCITGGWSTGSEDTGGWFRYTNKGRSIVNWLT